MAKKVQKKKQKKRGKKKTISSEEKQLLWMIAIIAVVFISFLLPYLYFESLKKFESHHIRFRIEEYPGLTVYHGMFPSFSNKENTHNIFLRIDPRENNIPTKGSFTSFSSWALISFNEEVDSCRGEISRIMVDLSSFLKNGIGIEKIQAGASTIEHYNLTKKPYATCQSVKEGNVIIIEKSNQSVTYQSEENPYCYIIEISSCEDIAPIEKFMLQTHKDLYEQENKEE